MSNLINKSWTDSNPQFKSPKYAPKSESLSLNLSQAKRLKDFSVLFFNPFRCPQIVRKIFFRPQLNCQHLLWMTPNVLLQLFLGMFVYKDADYLPVARSSLSSLRTFFPLC